MSFVVTDVTWTELEKEEFLAHGYKYMVTVSLDYRPGWWDRLRGAKRRSTVVFTRARANREISEANDFYYEADPTPKVERDLEKLLPQLIYEWSVNQCWQEAPPLRKTKRAKLKLVGT